MKRLFWVVFVMVCFCSSLGWGGTARSKSPGVAASLSFLVPGAGQFYNGDYTKGAICLTATSVGLYFVSFTRSYGYGFIYYDYDQLDLDIYTERPFLHLGIGILVLNSLGSCFDAYLSCWKSNLVGKYGLDLRVGPDNVGLCFDHRF